MSGKAKFRLFLLAALMGLCGYVLFLMFQLRDPQTPIKTATALYHEGQDLEKHGQLEAAAAAYDRANVLFQHGIDRLHSPLHGLSKAEVEEMSGRALYLKALSIRDKHFARAAASGSPIPETRDSTTGSPFRNILKIPDSKDREEAAGNIRGAATFFLPKDFDVQVEALRLELMSNVPQWQAIERACKAILEVQPNDTRAKYLLARYDYEQPQLASNQPTPTKKRSFDRVTQSLEYIDEVRNDRNFPMWRTEFLRAQIHGWLLWYYEYEKKNEKKFFEQLNILDNMLLDETVGAVARIKNGDNMQNLSRWDVDGILGLHVAAVDVALEKLRKQKEVVDDGLMGRLLAQTLEFSQKKIEAKDPAFPPRNLIRTILTVMTEGQSVLSINNKRQWINGIDALRPLLKEEEKAERLDPAHTAEFAGILMREAYLNRANKDDKIRVKYRAEARQWLDTGMKYGRSHNLDNQQMLPFYLTAANVVYFAASPREEFEPYLHALQESKSPRAQATALVLDAAYDELEGRLEKAHFKLEQAIKIRDGEEGLRAHAALTNIYMAMGRPENALVSLSHLENIFEKWNELNNAEKEWIAQFLRSPEEFYANLLICNLENARKNVARFQRLNPRAKGFPPALVANFEGRARDLLTRELPKQNAAGFKAHVAYINYLLATGRVVAAEKFFEELNRDYSDRFELLALRIGIMQESAKASGDPQRLRSLRDDCDKVFKDFIASHKNMVSAQLYYATYLAHTNRIEESLNYLKELSTETSLTPELKRLIVAIILAHNQGTQAQRLLRHLPQDLEVDSVMLDLSRNIEDQQRDIHTALTRHETVGLARLMRAEDTFAKGDFAKSADEFAKLLDFTRTKGVAQKGVIKSMFALVRKDPQKASDLIVAMLTEYPREPIMLLSAAYVYLFNDNIGHNTDNFNDVRNMGSALNMWEKIITDQGVASPTEVPLTRAEYWFLANRPDIAREELQRAIANDNKNAGVLLASIMMALDDPSREPRPEIREYAKELKKLMPEAATSHHIAARVEEFMNRTPAPAIDLYEQMLPKFPKDRVSYVRLVDLLDANGEYDRGLKWAKIWRKEMPIDLQAITAEVRFLARKKDLVAARTAGAQFVEETDKRALKVSEVYKDKDAKLQEERRKMIVEDAHWTAEFEIARGFYLGGAYDECQARLARMPEKYQKRRFVQELVGEIHAKKGEWDKAEAVFGEMFKTSRFDLQAANNYAYVLSEYRGQPEKAREVVQETLKGKDQAFSIRSADRFPPDFLATVGTIYVKLNQKALGKEMQDFFEAAKERYPNDPRVYYYRGMAKEFRGELTAAKSDYDLATRKVRDQNAMTDVQVQALLKDLPAAQLRIQAKIRDPNLLNK